MSARSGCTFAMLTALAACSGKERPFGDAPIEGLGGSSAVGPTTVEPGTAVTSPPSGLDPSAMEGEPLVGVSLVDTLPPPDDTSQSSGILACQSDAGFCISPDAGPVPAACIATGPRDCTSDADNDCDGQPDNTLDAVCACVSGASERCDEHPGLDGQGPCRAGLRTCVVDEVTLATAWGGCEGAIGPSDADSCEPGNDADCDGIPNEGCSCVDGQPQACGSITNTGPCQIGTSICVDGRFGPCVGAVAPATADSCSSRNDDSNCNGIPFDGCSCVNDATEACGMTDTGVCQLGTRTCVNGAFGQCVGQVNPRGRDCRSQQDNDCDGRADNIIDNVCRCSIGSSAPCETHPRQDGVGRCRAGSQQCVAGQNNSSSFFGACSGSVGPLPRDCESPQDNDCDGRPDNTIDGVCRAPECGDGITNGDEDCDAGRNPLPQPGGCNPECTGVYATKQIRRSLDIHGSNLGGIAGADAICAGDFGQGWKALLVGSSRRATLSPFVGDGQLDWVLKPFTYYFNERNQLAWRTDAVALLGSSGGEQEPLLAPLFITTPLNGGGSYPWSGYDIDWTTTTDTCNSWTSAGGRDANGQFMQGSFVTETLGGIAVERCSGTPYLFLLCVEQ